MEENAIEMNSCEREFERMLTFLERSLRNCEDSVTLINGFLQGAAHYYGADRAYIIEADCEIGVGLNSYEWCMPSVEPHKDKLQFLTREAFSRWQEYLDENKPVIIQDVSELEDTLPDEYAVYQKCGVRSLICAPFSKCINRGFIGVNNPTRHTTEPSFLFMICYVVVQELNEIKMQETVNAAEKRTLQYNDKAIHIKTFGGLEISCNNGVINDDEIKTDQGLLLLCYLLLNHNHPYCPMEKLYEIVRPSDITMDSNPSNAVKSAVTRIRKCLSAIKLEKLIIGKGGTYMLNPELEIDTDFERLEQLGICFRETDDIVQMQKYYDEVKEIYRGSILPRISDQMWMLPITTLYQSYYISMIKEYALRTLQVNNPLGAMSAIKEGLSIEPDNSALHSLMIYYLAIHGNTAVAQNYLTKNSDYLLPAHTDLLQAAICKHKKLSIEELRSMIIA